MIFPFSLFAQETESAPADQVNTEQSTVMRTEPFTLDDWLYLYQEGIIEDDGFPANEVFSDDEDYLDDEPPLAQEESTDTVEITEDVQFLSEMAGAEYSHTGDEISFSEEETRLAEEDSHVKDTHPEDAVLSDNEDFIASALTSDEDDFYNDDDFFLFEGPDLILEVPVFETRSFEDIFPNLSRRQRSNAMTANGLRTILSKDEMPTLVPNPELGIDLLSSVIKKNPSHIIEMVKIVRYNTRELDLLDIYNAVGRIGSIKDYPVPFRGEDYYVFTESSRLDNSRRKNAINDPAPANFLPFEETLYLRLKEATVGNIFIRGDISISVYGLTYNMTNFQDVWYFVVPIMKAERFSIVIYLEPVKEGVLIYCVTGFYIPNIVADRVNLTSPINRRIQVFLNWITDGLRLQEEKGM